MEEIIMSQNEVTKTTSPYESAELLLRLYDLRREKVMRKARDWMFSYKPESAQEYSNTMMDPKVGGYLRMVVSYWDMAATLVNRGLIDAELFNETVGEHVMVYAKIEPILDELRSMWESPEMCKNLEKVIMDKPNGMQDVRKMQDWMNSTADDNNEEE
jgi:hypothetical protein